MNAKLPRMTALFVPGWGARAFFTRALSHRVWDVLQPPSFRASHGKLDVTYFEWLRGQLATAPSLGLSSPGTPSAQRSPFLQRRGSGAAVERLVLSSPAGLPLSKPMQRAGLAFVRQLLAGVYPLRPALESARSGRSWRRVAALRLAQAVYRLELRDELEAIRRRVGSR